MSERISFRVDFITKTAIVKQAEKYNVPVSQLLLDCFFSQQKSLKEKYSLQFEIALQEKNFKEKREIRRRDNHRYYLYNNTLRTMVNLTIPRLCRGESPNWKVLDKVIDDANNIFATYSKQDQELLKDDMIYLNELNEEEFIKVCSSIYGKEFIKKVKGVEMIK